MASVDNTFYNSIFLVVARFFSDFGAFLNMVALSSYTYMLGQNAVLVGIVLTGRVLGGITASLGSTNIFRKYPGAMPLALTDMLRAGALSLIIIIPQHNHLLILPLVAFVLGFGNTIFSVGLNSQIPYLVKDNSIIKINSLLTSFSSLGTVLGSLSAGVILIYSSYSGLFGINMVVYIVAAFLILPLRFNFNRYVGKNIPKFIQEWRLLIQGLKGFPILLLVLIVALTDTLGSAAHSVGLPIFSKIINDQEPEKIMGYILAIWAIGKFMGAQFTNTLNRYLGTDLQKQIRLMEYIFFASIALMSLGFIAVFQFNHLLPILIAAFFAGIGDGFAEVAVITRVQKTDETIRLPAFSLLRMMQSVGFAIGMLISSFFFEFMFPAYVVLIFHGVPLVMTLVSLYKTYLYYKKN
ncbi:MAG: MFS transporter [Alphaproteobacteria bacterium]|nr:MFS transporter [Alphaproteobacteria bacterium]